MISKPWLTAIHRTKQSAPMRYLLDNNLINNQHIILDYGCGYGFDVKQLSQLGYSIVGYDKFISPFNKNTHLLSNKYDIITSFFVLNTIEDKNDRINTLKNILELLKTNGVCFLAVRSFYEFEKSKPKSYKNLNDGIITTRGTFQKYFSLSDINDLISTNFNSVVYEILPTTKTTILIKIIKER